MASYLRPRRGKKATAIAQLTASAPLKRGEVFFEVPDGGTGTGAGKIKMGDGSTAYESLPYFLEPFDPNSATVGFTDATGAESDPYTTNATHANAIVPSANLKTIFTNLKQLLLNYNSQLTTLNNELAYFSEEKQIGGNWIDGKPIYRICYIGIPDIKVSTDTVYLIPNSINCNYIDTLINISANYRGNNSGTLAPYTYYRGSSASTTIDIDATGVRLFSVGQYLYSYTIIIEYTKK